MCFDEDPRAAAAPYRARPWPSLPGRSLASMPPKANSRPGIRALVARKAWDLTAVSARDCFLPCVRLCQPMDRAALAHKQSTKVKLAGDG